MTNVDIGVNTVRDTRRVDRYRSLVDTSFESSGDSIVGDENRESFNRTLAEVELIRSHIRPHEPYERNRYPSQLKADVEIAEEDVGEAIVDDPTGKHRPSYYGSLTEGASTELASIGVYNAPPNRDERKTVSLNLHWANEGPNHWDAVAVYRDCLRESLKKNDVVCVLPFHGEAGVAHKSVSYATSILGVENVIASSTGKSPQAEDEVLRALHGQEDRFVTQGNILTEMIDWRAARDCYGIPLLSGEDPALPPSQARKGFTMLAGVLGLMRKDQLSRSRVVFHDTDIENPTHYQALEWLAVPLLDPPAVDEYVPAVYVAKTGPGRNNETQIISASVARYMLANMPMYNDTIELDPKGEQLLRQYSTLVWMLTGERMVQGDLLRQMPWSSGMTIETTINLFLLGRQISTESLNICQVLNPQRKVECATAAHEREMSMMKECGRWLTRNALHTAFCGKFLHEYNEDDLAAINVNAFKPNVGRMQNFRHRPNSTVTIAQDCIIGSIDHMLREGILKL